MVSAYIVVYEFYEAMMIPEVGDDDYSRCKLRQTVDKQRDNLECMQRNAVAARPAHTRKI